MAALAEIAYRSPATITSMFIVNGDGTYTVRFYNNGKADYVTVDSQLPSGYASIANELWVGLAEKAWAQFYEVIYGYELVQQHCRNVHLRCLGENHRPIDRYHSRRPVLTDLTNFVDCI